ncbi:hypothetical protein Tco_0037934 [Tanacetum coccineum]
MTITRTHPHPFLYNPNQLTLMVYDDGGGSGAWGEWGGGSGGTERKNDAMASVSDSGDRVDPDGVGESVFVVVGGEKSASGKVFRRWRWSPQAVARYSRRERDICEVPMINKQREDIVMILNEMLLPNARMARWNNSKEVIPNQTVTVVKKTRKKRIARRTKEELPTSTRRRFARRGHIQEGGVRGRLDNGELLVLRVDTDELELLGCLGCIPTTASKKKWKKRLYQYKEMSKTRPKTRNTLLKGSVLEYYKSKKEAMSLVFLGGMCLNVERKKVFGKVSSDGPGDATIEGFPNLSVSWFMYKDTRDEDKDTRCNTRDGKASREGENHTRESASILHEFYNDIGKLGLE